MMAELAFKVSDLLCSYNKRDVVIRVDSLSIFTNSIVFVVGPSGIGKSTLLETLGLMNNTIDNPNEASIQFYANDEKTYELANSWSKSDDELAAVRAKYFSFIFQETNLMPGLTSGQNLSMKMLIQGKTMHEAKRQATHFMSQLDLHEDVFDRMTHELSGGQRQRLAFLRAFLGEFQVLFCDEPTGNLDKVTAERLMQILQTSIKSNQRSSAIIVSHDLSLAKKYADMIVPIIPESNALDPDKKSGRISMEYVCTRTDNNWSSMDHSEIEDLESHLRNMFAQV